MDRGINRLNVKSRSHAFHDAFARPALGDHLQVANGRKTSAVLVLGAKKPLPARGAVPSSVPVTAVEKHDRAVQFGDDASARESHRYNDEVPRPQDEMQMNLEELSPLVSNSRKPRATRGAAPRSQPAAALEEHHKARQYGEYEQIASRPVDSNRDGKYSEAISSLTHPLHTVADGGGDTAPPYNDEVPWPQIATQMSASLKLARDNSVATELANTSELSPLSIDLRPPMRQLARSSIPDLDTRKLVGRDWRSRQYADEVEVEVFIKKGYTPENSPRQHGSPRQHVSALQHVSSGSATSAGGLATPIMRSGPQWINVESKSSPPSTLRSPSIHARLAGSVSPRSRCRLPARKTAQTCECWACLTWEAEDCRRCAPDDCAWQCATGERMRAWPGGVKRKSI
jgi:hypothetical protein